MLYKLSSRAGQLVRADTPVAATFFIDAVMSGEELSARESLHIVITYLRLGNEEKPKYINIEPENVERTRSLENR
jgi:hypothetical protein